MCVVKFSLGSHSFKNACIISLNDAIRNVITWKTVCTLFVYGTSHNKPTFIFESSVFNTQQEVLKVSGIVVCFLFNFQKLVYLFFKVLIQTLESMPVCMINTCGWATHIFIWVNAYFKGHLIWQSKSKRTDIKGMTTHCHQHEIQSRLDDTDSTGIFVFISPCMHTTMHAHNSFVHIVNTWTWKLIFSNIVMQELLSLIFSQSLLYVPTTQQMYDYQNKVHCFQINVLYVCEYKQCLIFLSLIMGKIHVYIIWFFILYL